MIFIRRHITDKYLINLSCTAVTTVDTAVQRLLPCVGVSVDGKHINHNTGH